MKLQKLTIHNIASIEDATIDFEAQPLADSEVFLITGKTGSGKSTILDAICLALYADTPRLSGTHMQGKTEDAGKQLSIDDPCQLMRRNSVEAYAKLTFTGNNLEHYEATWSVRRTKTGKLKGKEWTLTDLDSGIVYDLDQTIKEKIKDAIGLDFKQFRRTTLLAQGEFTLFLNSKDDDKAEILEKITGMDTYAKVGEKVYSITSRKKELKIDAQNKIQGIKTLTDEEISAKKAEIAAIEEQLSGLKAAVETDRAKLQWIKTLDELTKAVGSATEALAAEYREMLGVYKSAGQEKVNLEKAIGDTAIYLDSESERKAVYESWQAIYSLMDSIALGRRKISDEQTNIVRESKLLTETLQPALDKAHKEAQDAQEAYDKLTTGLKEREKALDNLHLNDLRKQRDNDRELLNDIATTYDRIATLKRERERRATQAQALKETMAGIEKRQKESDTLAPQVDTAKVKMEACRAMLDRQKDTIDKFARTLRQNLHTGDLCPVCRQVISGELPHEEELARLVNELKRAYDDAEKAYNELAEKKNKTDAEIKSATDSYRQAADAFGKDRSVENAVAAVIAACSKCRVDAKDGEAIKKLEELRTRTESALKATEGMIAEGEKAESAIKELRRTLESQHAALEKLKQAEDKAQQAIKDCKGRIGIAEGIVKTKKEEVDVAEQKASTIITGQWDADWRTQPGQFAAELKQKAGVYNSALERRQQLDRRLAQLATDCKQAGEVVEEIQRQMPSWETLAPTVPTSTTDLPRKTSTVLAKKAIVDEAVRRLEEHRQAKPEIGDEETADSLNERIAGNDLTMSAISEKKGAVDQELKTDQENRKQLGLLIEEAGKLDADYQKWSRLNQLIGDATGSKFRKIAQSYVLGSLIHSANSYMKTLTDRYTLKVLPGTFVILIEDAYQGYATRAASTISGGESFLVSLSLALALSDIGQRLAVDTLFIDEGFGTLSGEPLQNAINTLRTLHTTSGRHVGIISHVEELRERIPIQIQVNQEGNNSSSTVSVVS
ncbi:MAG: AAA family ATPase [Bacteroidales bacterium]|nr:AAA family ATPase [Bacteroidales bacterium]